MFIVVFHLDLRTSVVLATESRSKTESIVSVSFAERVSDFYISALSTSSDPDSICGIQVLRASPLLELGSPKYDGSIAGAVGVKRHEVYCSRTSGGSPLCSSVMRRRESQFSHLTQHPSFTETEAATRSQVG